jgi:lipopolysaccharide/colanic/teichoic acid biosynthesis glycosyltransferase
MDIRANPKSSARLTLAARHSTRDLVAQELFLQMLCLERKRAERSGRTFLLVLLNAEELKEQQISEKIRSVVFSSIRETDIGGWYKECYVAGIIFTEIAASDEQRTQLAMLARLTSSLRAQISSQHVDQIRISFHFFPEDKGSSSSGFSADENLYPDLLHKADSKRLSHLLKRAMDIVGSFVGLSFLLPLFAAIALAIKLNSKGPVFFRQQRVGQYGRHFAFLKFRTMKQSSDSAIHKEYMKQFISGNGKTSQSAADGRALTYKITDDPRVTLIGRLLRKSSLDELPQLWSVLTGEMSLVGPRPPIPYELDSYAVWHRRRLLETKPGITGLWQVNGRSRTTFDDMVRLDLRYARMWSLWVDVKILLQTPKAILSGKGAY